jgi:rubrerythrin
MDKNILPVPEELVNCCFYPPSVIIFNQISDREERRMGKNTQENLKEAFAGESQANRTYLAFAKRAEEDGYSQVAKLFRAAAEAETVHAHNHLRVMKGIQSTKENLQAAINGETHEFKKMYPEMMAAAKGEKNEDAVQTFHYANEVEKIHAALYAKALENLGKNEVLDYYVCPFCGNTVEKVPPEKCPICGAPGKKFMKIA